MPTYVYRCGRGHETEKFEPMSAPVEQKCPTCGPVEHEDWCESCRMFVTEQDEALQGQCTCPDRMHRQIGAGAGFTFKGGAPTIKFHTRRK